MLAALDYRPREFRMDRRFLNWIPESYQSSNSTLLRLNHFQSLWRPRTLCASWFIVANRRTIRRVILNNESKWSKETGLSDVSWSLRGYRHWTKEYILSSGLCNDQTSGTDALRRYYYFLQREHWGRVIMVSKLLDQALSVDLRLYCCKGHRLWAISLSVYHHNNKPTGYAASGKSL